VTTTSRVVAEEASARAMRIIESLPGFAWSADADGKFTYVSSNTLAFLGEQRDDLNSSEKDEFGWRRVVHPDDYDRVADRWRQCLQTGDHYDAEHRLRRADGVYRWFRNSARPFSDSGGHIIEWHGTTLEIEDQKQIEAALRERERELSHLVDMVPSHVWRLAPDGEPLFFNKRMIDFLGLDVAGTDKPGMSRLEAVITTVIHSDDAGQFREDLSRCLVTGENFAMRYRLRRADGAYRWMSSRAEPVRNQIGIISQWYGLCHDIDDQMRAEDVLRQSERRLQQMIDAVPALIWCTTPDGTPTYLNKRYTEVTGIVLEDLTAPDGSPAPLAITHPDDRAAAAAVRARAFGTGAPYIVKYRQIRRDGSYRWTETRAEALRDESGAILQWYGVAVDIDDLMTAQEVLRQSEWRLREQIDAVPAMTWSTSCEGTPTYVNKRFTDVTGATLQDIIAPDGAPSLSIIHPEDRGAAMEAFGRSFKTGVPYVMQYRQIRRDGSYRWTETRAEPLRDASGAVLQWYGVSVDIHDLLTAQAALRDRERELSQIVDMVPVHIRRLTPQGEPTFFNKRLLDFFGLELADLDKPGMNRLAAAIKTLVHPDDAARLLATVRHSLTTGESYSMKYRMRRADGEYRWVDGRAEPLRDETGAIVQWYVISIDIEDEVRAQKALRDRERELSLLVDMVPTHVWRLAPDGEPTFYNKRLIDFLGMDVADLAKPGISRLASAIVSLVHPSDAPGLEAALKRSFATGEPFSMRYRMRRADGVFRWLESRAAPLRADTGAILQWYGANIDIDDLVTAQETLSERERELSQLVDIVPSLLWRLSPEGTPVFFSKRMIEYFGSDIDQYDMPGMQGVGAAIADLVHPEDSTKLAEALKHSFVTGESFSLNYRLRRLDGVYRWMSGRAEPMRDANGRIVQWYGLSHDIDDQVRIEETLRERERFLWQLVETLPAMIDCAAPNGEPVYRSQQLREFLGYGLEELDESGRSRLTGTLDAGVHPDDVAGVKEQYARSLLTGEPYARRHRLRRFDGEFRWVETRAAPMRNTEDTIVQWNVICLDIDGEVRAQEKLRLSQESLARASQAASLAELSASIAHEVNQPLAAVVANSHACHRWLSAEPANLERAKITSERIIRDANAAADVVSRIRALFKQSPEPRNSTSLSSVISEARNLMAEEATRRRVRVEIDVERDLPLVAFDRVQIQQVLINLIRNGIDATEDASCDRIIEIRARQMDNMVQTEISDRGSGVEFPDKVFEPFFTTKDHGMGMGLAICRSIVEFHGGRLWVEKNEPHGATFIFTLPAEVKPTT